MKYLGKDLKDYPKVAEWHDVVKDEDGIKEVHVKWYSNVLPEV
jgi:hypothetical protein